MGQVYKSAGIEAAKIAGRSPEMDIAAAEVMARVVALAAPHTKTGTYNRKLKIKNIAGRRGVRDRAVVSDDPQAMNIEFGHWWVTPEGHRIRWIKGLFIFRRAVASFGKR